MYNCLGKLRDKLRGKVHAVIGECASDDDRTQASQRYVPEAYERPLGHREGEHKAIVHAGAGRITENESGGWGRNGVVGGGVGLTIRGTRTE